MVSSWTLCANDAGVWSCQITHIHNKWLREVTPLPKSSEAASPASLPQKSAAVLHALTPPQALLSAKPPDAELQKVELAPPSDHCRPEHRFKGHALKSVQALNFLVQIERPDLFLIQWGGSCLNLRYHRIKVMRCARGVILFRFYNMVVWHTEFLNAKLHKNMFIVGQNRYRSCLT